MKIRLLSDLHHEFYESTELYENKDSADVLVIAGDLDVGYQRCWQALKRFADYHEHVVYVPGNHEYYHNNIAEFDSYIKRFSTGTNIHFLNPNTKKIGDVVFIGATLWSNFNQLVFSKLAASQSITDFRVISGFSTDKCAQLNTDHTKFFKEAYQLPGKKVFVSHFLPDRACISPRFRGNSAINDYFANTLGDWISTLEESTWLFGHTHDLVDIHIGSTRVIANPYGYNKNHNYTERLINV